MIYLFEDKTSRRNDYGWTDDRFERYKDAICLIDCFEKFAKYSNEGMLSSDNIILYHESFYYSMPDEKQNQITSFILEVEHSQFSIAKFSGSKSQRTLDGNVCHLPAQVLYLNLEYFILKSICGDVDFKYLMFGQKPELEDNLRFNLRRVNDANMDTDGNYRTDKNLFFFISSEEPLTVPFTGITQDDNFDFSCDDSSLCNSIAQNLENEKFDGIYIPLCFGETFSDFMGLRLAMLIRFACHKNKLTPLIIYGEASYADLVNHECFDILKTVGVYYVHADNQSLYTASTTLSDISLTDYTNGLKQIYLNIPSHLDDNHNISNKWAIYRWAHFLHASDENIENNEKGITESLYFLYMAALYSVKEMKPLSTDKLKIKAVGNQPPLKILYVDDQADEGWYELLCSLLYDMNQLDFNYIGNELKALSTSQIIEAVKQKVVEVKPNVVILDLRLHRSDFGNMPLENITGFQLLEAIKKMNRGIQVIMFSATSKIWNFQQLLKAEADGFVIKESPADSIDPTFTEKSIRHFISCLKECATQTYRIDLWQQMQEDHLALKNLQKKHKINREYAEAVNSLLIMAEDSMFAKDMKYSYASIFMNFFRIIEATANEWFDDEPKKKEDGTYYFTFRSNDSMLFDLKDCNWNNSSPVPLVLYKPSLPNKQKIYNIFYKLECDVKEADAVVNKRNSFTHPNLIKNDSIESFTIEDVQNVYDIVHKIIKNQP